MKKILKNKWFWVAVIVAFLWWNYRRNVAAKQGTGTARTNNNVVSVANWVGNPNKVKYFVMLTNFYRTKWEIICQRTKEAKCDGIVFPLELGRILNNDGSYNWADIDFAIETAAKYNLQLDVKYMTQFSAGQAFELTNLFSEGDWMKGTDGKTEWGFIKLLSLSSTKWQTVILPFVDAFCARYKAYNEKGYIYCSKVVTTAEQEFGYPFDSFCDDSESERRLYGAAIPRDPKNLNYYKFKVQRLRTVFDSFNNVLKKYGYTSCYDIGSSIDDIAVKRGTMALEYSARNADIIKENPDFKFDIDFAYSNGLSIAKRLGKKWFCEITWTNIADLQERKRVFLAWTRQAVEWGCSYIALAFLDPSSNEAFLKLKELTKELEQSGHLTKNVQPINLAGDVTYKVSEMINAGGHLNASIISRFNAAKQSGRPTNITIVNDL